MPYRTRKSKQTKMFNQQDFDFAESGLYKYLIEQIRDKDKIISELEFQIKTYRRLLGFTAKDVNAREVNLSFPTHLRIVKSKQIS